MGFRDEERGQSVQIGAIILFASLIILFSTYQAVVVPNQNRQVEFNHNQRVQGDMLELRNTLLETKTTGEDGYATVELGTEFPPRLVALNPPAPSGSLSTTAARPITVEDASGTDITAEVCPGNDFTTRFVQYTPSYAVYQSAGTIRYEHSLLYRDFGEQVARLSSQQLVSGDTVQLTPLNTTLSRSGSETVAVEPIAGLVDRSVRQDFNVTLPTQLTETQWEAALDGQIAPGNVYVTEGASGRNLTVALNGEYAIECGPVGLGQTPSSGPRGGGVNEINPASPGDITLIGESRSGSNVTLSFNNTAGTNNFTEGRINFYQAQGGGPTQANVSQPGQPVSATLPIRGDFRTFDPDITLNGEGAISEVTLTFDNNPNPNDWFIVTLKLETGETALYFVPVGS